MEPTLEPVVSSHLARFNLKSLLLAVALVGILLTPTRRFGGAYLISVAFSSVLVIACERAYRHGTRAGTFALALGAAIIAFPLAIFMTVFLVHAFLNLVLCTVLILLSVRPRTLVVATAGLGLALYGFVLWSGAERVRVLVALKAKYPFVSLDNRLSFEQTVATPSLTPVSQLQLTPAVAANLDTLEQFQDERRYYGRTWALYALHEDSYNQFARAAGFGVSRMPMVRAERIELEPRDTIIPPLPLAMSSINPSKTELSPVHQATLFDFLNPERMGYARSRREVAGFESHGFESLPNRLGGRRTKPERWQVVRLELVSLLRHQPPRVYVAESLPQMDQLAKIPHRALNEFEACALPKLTTSQDVVIDQQSGRIQMLGAVRAGTSCLECHEGLRGKLLGAFSYEITPLVNTDQAAN